MTPTRDKTVLVIGSGAREHALAKALARSRRVARVLVAPGNGLVESDLPVPIVRIPEVSLEPDDLLALATRHDADLTVVGPEAPLAAGIVDRFESAYRRIFGPTRKAAELESSKAFSKSFMLRHQIPTAQGRAFASYHEARAALAVHPLPVVIKASGLASGKGVFICHERDHAEDVLWRMMEVGDLGPAGREVVLEACLEGPEVSILAITDGEHLHVLPPVRDHKRLRDQDLGPNTGGMGAFTPVPDCDAATVDLIRETILEPAVSGLLSERRRFVGVLYAGVILTADGPRCLEFNVRFGDPEAEVLLPLIETDLYDLFDAAIDHRLHEVPLGVSTDACAAVVLAAEGYPGRITHGTSVPSVEHLPPYSEVYGGAVERLSSGLMAIGGRVLTVVGRGLGLPLALERAYAAVDVLKFEGCQYRTDIGISLRHSPAPKPSAYVAAGVDIDAAHATISGLRPAIESTYNPHVLSKFGAFAGLFSARALSKLEDPVLVASTDGVGTKALLARALGRFDTLGLDLVHHCVNDILVMGGRPLFFLDQLASSRLEPAHATALVTSIAQACRALGIALLGGETAEMPGVYVDGAFDLSGTIVGVVDRVRILDGRRITRDHRVYGLPSSGLHTNGYSLARRALEGLPLDSIPSGFELPLGETLLKPHRAYLSEIELLWNRGIFPSGLVHITGGGLLDNPPRILPDGLSLELDLSRVPRPAIFRLIAQRAEVTELELRRVFNLGVGLLVLLSPDDVESALEALPELATLGELGRVVPTAHDGSRVIFRDLR
jgi:phosphoribosylamine--glycine ligase/phosphoribosylformylglycinamidine cyclo-ligase